MDITTAEAFEATSIFPEAKGGAWMVMAQTEAGEIYLHERGDLAESDAQYLAKVVGLSGKITDERWVFWRTVYGSAAFEEEEASAVVAAESIRRGIASEEDFKGTRVGTLL